LEKTRDKIFLKKNGKTGKNEKVEFFFFVVMFLIEKEFHHLHKVMGEANTSPWHKQHNKLIIRTLVTRQTNNNTREGKW
jgi:hypothetical protein